jgi:hypothetical protein
MTDRIEFDQGGVPHEFIVGGAHLERMDDGHWFLSMGRADGTSVAVWLKSDRPITVTYETRDAGRFWIDQVAELEAVVERLRALLPEAAARIVWEGMEPLGPDFERVWDENLATLYSNDPLPGKETP